jgi:hypothetical protein
MTSQQREQLIGYLLGALDDDERSQVEALIERQPELRAELETLKRTIYPLAADMDDDLPPPDLVGRTCDYVWRESRLLPVELSAECEQPMRLRDLAVAASILCATLLILFPAVSYSRFTAEMNGCRENLRHLGQALARFSEDHGGYFPVVPEVGPLSAAGSYAPQLMAVGLLREPRYLQCPGNANRDEQFRVPTIEEIRVAGFQQRAQLLEQAGGDYGYRLGYVHEGRYVPVRNLRRELAVILSDTPSRNLDGSPSTNHGSRGQNFLFESGSVKFLKTCSLVDNDHCFLNDDGLVAPGRHADDTVVAPSHAQPVVWIIGD